MDLPVAHKFAMDAEKENAKPEPASPLDASPDGEEDNNLSQLNSDQDEGKQPLIPSAEEKTEKIDAKKLHHDPIHELALAAGYEDGENGGDTWWSIGTILLKFLKR